MIIIRQKVFAKINPKEIKEWLNTLEDGNKLRGFKPGDDGKYTKEQWDEIIEAFKNRNNSNPTSTPPVVKGPSARELLEQENKKISEESIFNKGKQYAKDLWKNHKVAIGVTGGTLAASGLAYGGYKYLKNKDREDKEADENDAVRSRIVNGNKS